MSKPNVSVVVEPAEGSAVAYEPVAPRDTSSKGENLVCLKLTITNHESKQIQLEKVTLSFAGPPNVADKVIPVPNDWWPPDGDGVKIAPGSWAVWNFLREGGENDTAVLPEPPPKAFTLKLSFKGFSTAWTVTKNLAAHKNPPAAHSYLYPAQFDDLRAGEFWLASSNTHGTGADGSQLFGYDMGVYAWDESKNAVDRILPGKSGKENKHYRTWGKQVHAMADGTVVHFLDGVGANYKPGTGDLAGPWEEPPWDNDTKAWNDHVGAGNHFYLQHGDEVVLYAHMQAGSLPKKLLKNGATVKAGDVLGLAGNAGSSSEPHLHTPSIEGTQAEVGPLRPLLFHDIFAIAPADLSFPGHVRAVEAGHAPGAARGADRRADLAARAAPAVARLGGPGRADQVAAGGLVLGGAPPRRLHARERLEAEPQVVGRLDLAQLPEPRRRVQGGPGRRLVGDEPDRRLRPRHRRPPRTSLVGRQRLAGLAGPRRGREVRAGGDVVGRAPARRLRDGRRRQAQPQVVGRLDLARLAEPRRHVQGRARSRLLGLEPDRRLRPRHGRP